MLFDSHCHLQFNSYKDDHSEVVERCREKGVICNVVGTQKDTSKMAVELASRFDFIYATIGLHPIHIISTEVDEEETTFKSREEDFDENYYGELAKSKKVIAVGECGLELCHIPPDQSRETILEKQEAIFLKQFRFADKHNLPLVIHVREAHAETADILRRQASTKGVVHCYTSDWDRAKQYLEMGLYLGFTGVITFPPKKISPQTHSDLLETVKKCPLDRLLIETDAPYLAPQAWRGERCEPWMVLEVAKKVAELKSLALEEVVQASTENSKRLFKIDAKD